MQTYECNYGMKTRRRRIGTLPLDKSVSRWNNLTFSILWQQHHCWGELFHTQRWRNWSYFSFDIVSQGRILHFSVLTFICVVYLQNFPRLVHKRPVLNLKRLNFDKWVIAFSVEIGNRWSYQDLRRLPSASLKASAKKTAGRKQRSKANFCLPLFPMVPLIHEAGCTT